MPHELYGADFGVVADGAADDTDAIQRTIDALRVRNIQTARLPSGRMKITRPVYLDPPDNLRGTKKYSQFSLHLTGDQGGMSNEAQGSCIDAWHTDGPAIIVGPGRGMRLSHLQIANQKVFRQTPYAYAKLAGNACIGVAVAAGTSKFSMNHSSVGSFHTGVKTGWNGDNLADSNSFIECAFRHNYIGAHFAQTQNYINSFVNCDVASKFGILSDVGKAVNVHGGNYSYNGRFKRYSLTGIVLKEVFRPLYHPTNTPRFTAAVTNPDGLLDNMILDVGAVRTAYFGTVPLVLEAFDTASGSLTFSVASHWMYHVFGDNYDGTLISDLLNEVRAATLLYAAEAAATFTGTGFNVSGVHIENPTSVTTVVDHWSGFTGDAHNVFDKVYFNWTAAQEINKGTNTDSEALFWCQQNHPLVRSRMTGQGEIVLRDWNIKQTEASEPVCVHMLGQGVELRAERVDWYAPNVYLSANAPPLSGYDGYATSSARAAGIGHYDVSPFLPRIAGADSGTAWRGRTGRGQSPFLGNRPAPWVTPRVREADIGQMDPFKAVPMCGGATYSVDGASTVFARHNGAWWTWGQDFACDWSFKGQSNVVNVGDVSRFFAGLQVILLGQPYIVLGVYPFAKYITVTPMRDFGSYLLPGDKVTVYSGSIVGQEPYKITKVSAAA